MIEPDDIDRIFALAQTKSDLHRAIDALPESAAMILVANACCCGDTSHDPHVGSTVYHIACGAPSLAEAIGLLRLAEHNVIAKHSA
jgi:hypothetical protein